MLTGTRPVSEELGRKLETVTVDELGSAERVVLTKDTTTIIGGAGDPGAVSGRCDELRRQIKDTTSDYDREKLEERLAKLSGGVALIRVGATSEAELKRQKEAFDDAISSTKAAEAEGIVPGGGAALLRAIGAVEDVVVQQDADDLVEGRITADHDRGRRHQVSNLHPASASSCRHRAPPHATRARAPSTLR